MNDGVPNLRGGHFETIKWIVQLAVGAALFFGGKFYEMGRNAEQTDIERTQQTRDHMRLDDVEKTMVGLSKDISHLSGDFQDVKATIKDMSNKLDRQRR